MKHSKYSEIEKLVFHNINTLLSGPAGSGKSTILQQVSKELGYEFLSITGTRQTTVGSLLGFISVTGTYIPTLLRDAVENGKMFVIEEVDGMDPNTLLCLNTIENGYLAFPDKLVDVHENFRLCATANPTDEHASYTGRSKLDMATLDRFDKVNIPKDNELEKFLTCDTTFTEVELMRKLLEDNSMSHTISMRDAIRFFKRKAISLDTGYELTLLKEEHIVKEYNSILRKAEPTKVLTQNECTTIEELWETIKKESE